jgi:hypothetical protein
MQNPHDSASLCGFSEVLRRGRARVTVGGEGETGELGGLRAAEAAGGGVSRSEGGGGDMRVPCSACSGSWGGDKEAGEIEIVGFYHVSTVGDRWIKTVRRQLSLLRFSGTHNAVRTIVVGASVCVCVCVCVCINTLSLSSPYARRFSGTHNAVRKIMVGASGYFSDVVPSIAEMLERNKTSEQVLSLLALLVQSTNTEALRRPLPSSEPHVGRSAQVPGTQFTCFTSTKVQILTQISALSAVCGPQSQGAVSEAGWLACS